MSGTTKTGEESAFPTAVVFDRAAGTTSHGVIIAPVDPAGQNARLVSAGLMSAGMAHDLGNLMQIIDAGIRGMERRFDHTTSPELLFLGGQVRGAASRAAALTRRMLDHTRGVEDSAEPVDIGAVISQMRALIGWAAGPYVRLVMEIEPSLPLTQCAPTDLELAVINLVVNARHAMPDGGALTLSVCRHGGDVMLRVADTGCGMSPEAARRACEPFYTSRPRAGGSGLGLAIVSTFIRAVGGAIHVDSTPGRGAAIMLIFPGAGKAARR